MYKAYLVTSILALGLYGYAQMKGWSLGPSAAQEFERRRVAEQQYRASGGTGSYSGRSSGGFSGK